MIHSEIGQTAWFKIEVMHGGEHSVALHLVNPKEPVGMAGGVQHFGFKLDSSDHDQVIKQVEAGGGKHDGKYPYAYVSDPDGYIIELSRMAGGGIE